MTSARRVSLASICKSVRYGYTASASVQQIGPNFLRITDIVPDSIDWHAVPFCKINDSDRQRFGLTPGDIVVARTGATVGYAKLIREPVDAVFASYLVSFKVDAEQADPGFVGRLVESFVYKRFVQSRVGGAAQPNANAQVLGSFEFWLPSRHEQERITNILLAYDDLIENNRRRIARLQDAARLLYREWFVYFRFPGHEHVQLINDLPEGWTRKSLRELCVSVEYGYTASAEAEPVGPKFLRITDIVQDTIDWSIVPHCTIGEGRSKKFALLEGDIVIARTGATVGYAKRLHKRHPAAVFASYLVRLRLRPDLDNLIAGIFVESDSYKKYVLSHVGGAAQPNANAQVLASAEMVVPPMPLQRAFRESVEPLFDLREVLQEQIRRLKEARDLLLPKLISGEVGV